MTKAPQYIGYGLFSDFLKALNFTEPVQCIQFTYQTTNKHGLTVCDAYIITSQTQSVDVIYHRFLTAGFHKMGNTLMGSDHADRSNSAYDLTLKLLEKHTIRPAMLSMPKTLEYTDGQHDLLHYDSETDLFYLKELVK